MAHREEEGGGTEPAYMVRGFMGARSGLALVLLKDAKRSDRSFGKSSSPLTIVRGTKQHLPLGIILKTSVFFPSLHSITRKFPRLHYNHLTTKHFLGIFAFLAAE